MKVNNFCKKKIYILYIMSSPIEDLNNRIRDLINQLNDKSDQSQKKINEIRTELEKATQEVNKLKNELFEKGLTDTNDFIKELVKMQELISSSQNDLNSSDKNEINTKWITWFIVGGIVGLFLLIIIILLIASNKPRQFEYIDDDD